MASCEFKHWDLWWKERTDSRGLSPDLHTRAVVHLFPDSHTDDNTILKTDHPLWKTETNPSPLYDACPCNKAAPLAAIAKLDVAELLWFHICILSKTHLRASEMAHRGKVPTAKPDNLSFIPVTFHGKEVERGK